MAEQGLSFHCPLPRTRPHRGYGRLTKDPLLVGQGDVLG